jgi:hypothetical protein
VEECLDYGGVDKLPFIDHDSPLPEVFYGPCLPGDGILGDDAHRSPRLKMWVDVTGAKHKGMAHQLIGRIQISKTIQASRWIQSDNYPMWDRMFG